MSIYAEIFIAGALDDIWNKTQTPEQHVRWDVRFSKILYLPKACDGAPQQFSYQTRIGFGIGIAGVGETVGERVSDTHRISALRFWSDDPKSLISTGSGYWKYEERDGGVRFLTRYDYGTRFGLAGRLFDRIIFRPLMGWATAWSFDRLRLWIEQGIDPAESLNNAVIHALARLSLAFIWLYHGLVPKLLTMHPDEVLPLTNAGLDINMATLGVAVAGLLEIAFSVVLLLTWTRRWVLLLNIPVMLVALGGVAVTAPSLLTAAFNPLTLNLCVCVIAFVGYRASATIPSAGRCLRKEQR